ncbi:polyketide cyclase/dehydrase/lipid transport protein [Antricoccus suffuscus]|uniref:Polyketide cyclase/dehydrase/lipid transport protein n=1 Tax=Antricoccus suffuscus TaxID=1629062 RepID=A0A2T1A2D4_9ACTN|nr:polyketide cyclase/dehydrase/lipid transport protein [Antricoccus suffuscus]
MVRVQRTFSVPVDSAKVAAYLRDFANAVHWDPGTISCTQSTSGPVAVGTKWTNVSKVLRSETELTYELTKDSADQIKREMPGIVGKYA